ncbi:carbohydrate sulfotransferase 11-like [Palaemon carinicauda]|uniref:carbohydrate sulfotransferase 11-like n=1 Tax=Palaemon carinicauda TaxID=392227 RepID=UPI0035B58922
MTSWFQTQEERKSAINKTCSSFDKKELTATMYAIKGSRQYLLYDDCHKAIYCSIPKVAKTSWSKAWMLLSRMTFNVTGINAQKVEEAFKDKTMKDILHKENLKYRLANYKKIIVVRNPMERLMAVYLDLTKKVSIGAGVLRTVKKTRPTATVGDITWPEFVNYIIREGVIDHQQFLPFEDVCHPCAIDYDFVVKLETFQEDSDNVVELIGGTESERVNLSPSENTLDSKKVDELWGLLSSAEKEALKRKYYRDIEMFGYL